MSSAPSEALPEERQREILRRLNSHGRVLAAELSTALAVSEDSIRRDLRELAARGLCRRVYGGASISLALSRPPRTGLWASRKKLAGRGT